MACGFKSHFEHQRLAAYAQHCKQKRQLIKGETKILVSGRCVDVGVVSLRASSLGYNVSVLWGALPDQLAETAYAFYVPVVEWQTRSVEVAVPARA